MDSLSTVCPSIVLPPSNSICSRRHRVSGSARTPHDHPPPLTSLFGVSFYPRPCGKRLKDVSCNLAGSGRGSGNEYGDGDGSEEVERALHMDGTIPDTSDEFVKRVSSRAYDMRRNLQQTFDSSSYDVLDSNPWMETSKPVYVLAQRENQLCTMKIRRSRSEVERELGLLFSKGGNCPSEIGNQSRESRGGTNFQMDVEDVRDGVLIFEDENEAAKYCDLLEGGGQGCEGVAEIEASSVFDLCRKMRLLAVLFRRGRTPPLPQSLELNLKARKRSLEDQENEI